MATGERQQPIVPIPEVRDRSRSRSSTRECSDTTHRPQGMISYKIRSRNKVASGDAQPAWTRKITTRCMAPEAHECVDRRDLKSGKSSSARTPLRRHRSRRHYHEVSRNKDVSRSHQQLEEGCVPSHIRDFNSKPVSHLRANGANLNAESTQEDQGWRISVPYTVTDTEDMGDINVLQHPDELWNSSHVIDTTRKEEKVQNFETFARDRTGELGKKAVVPAESNIDDNQLSTYVFEKIHENAWSEFHIHQGSIVEACRKHRQPNHYDGSAREGGRIRLVGGQDVEFPPHLLPCSSLNDVRSSKQPAPTVMRTTRRRRGAPLTVEVNSDQRADGEHIEPLRDSPWQKSYIDCNSNRETSVERSSEKHGPCGEDDRRNGRRCTQQGRQPHTSRPENKIIQDTESQTSSSRLQEEQRSRRVHPREKDKGEGRSGTEGSGNKARGLEHCPYNPEDFCVEGRTLRPYTLNMTFGTKGDQLQEKTVDMLDFQRHGRSTKLKNDILQAYASGHSTSEWVVQNIIDSAETKRSHLQSNLSSLDEKVEISDDEGTEAPDADGSPDNPENEGATTHNQRYHLFSPYIHATRDIFEESDASSCTLVSSSLPGHKHRRLQRLGGKNKQLCRDSSSEDKLRVEKKGIVGTRESTRRRSSGNRERKNKHSQMRVDVSSGKSRTSRKKIALIQGHNTIWKMTPDFEVKDNNVNTEEHPDSRRNNNITVQKRDTVRSVDDMRVRKQVSPCIPQMAAPLINQISEDDISGSRTTHSSTPRHGSNETDESRDQTGTACFPGASETTLIQNAIIKEHSDNKNGGNAAFPTTNKATFAMSSDMLSEDDVTNEIQKERNKLPVTCQKETERLKTTGHSSARRQARGDGVGREVEYPRRFGEDNKSNVDVWHNMNKNKYGRTKCTSSSRARSYSMKYAGDHEPRAEEEITYTVGTDGTRKYTAAEPGGSEDLYTGEAAAPCPWFGSHGSSADDPTSYYSTSRDKPAFGSSQNTREWGTDESKMQSFPRHKRERSHNYQNHSGSWASTPSDEELKMRSMYDYGLRNVSHPTGADQDREYTIICPSEGTCQNEVSKEAERAAREEDIAAYEEYKIGLGEFQKHSASSDLLYEVDVLNGKTLKAYDSILTRDVSRHVSEKLKGTEKTQPISHRAKSRREKNKNDERNNETSLNEAEGKTNTTDLQGEEKSKIQANLNHHSEPKINMRDKDDWAAQLSKGDIESKDQLFVDGAKTSREMSGSPLRVYKGNMRDKTDGVTLEEPGKLRVQALERPGKPGVQTGGVTLERVQTDGVTLERPGKPQVKTDGVAIKRPGKPGVKTGGVTLEGSEKPGIHSSEVSLVGPEKPKVQTGGVMLEQSGKPQVKTGGVTIKGPGKPGVKTGGVTPERPGKARIQTSGVTLERPGKPEVQTGGVTLEGPGKARIQTSGVTLERPGKPEVQTGGVTLEESGKSEVQTGGVTLEQPAKPQVKTDGVTIKGPGKPGVKTGGVTPERPGKPRVKKGRVMLGGPEKSGVKADEVTFEEPEKPLVKTGRVTRAEPGNTRIKTDRGRNGGRVLQKRQLFKPPALGVEETLKSGHDTPSAVNRQLGSGCVSDNGGDSATAAAPVDNTRVPAPTLNRVGDEAHRESPPPAGMPSDGEGRDFERFLDPQLRSSKFYDVSNIVIRSLKEKMEAFVSRLSNNTSDMKPLIQQSEAEGTSGASTATATSTTISSATTTTTTTTTSQDLSYQKKPADAEASNTSATDGTVEPEDIGMYRDKWRDTDPIVEPVSSVHSVHSIRQHPDPKGQMLLRKLNGLHSNELLETGVRENKSQLDSSIDKLFEEIERLRGELDSPILPELKSPRNKGGHHHHHNHAVNVERKIDPTCRWEDHPRTKNRDSREDPYHHGPYPSSNRESIRNSSGPRPCWSPHVDRGAHTRPESPRPDCNIPVSASSKNIFEQNNRHDDPDDAADVADVDIVNDGGDDDDVYYVLGDERRNDGGRYVDNEDQLPKPKPRLCSSVLNTEIMDRSISKPYRSRKYDKSHQQDEELSGSKMAPRRLGSEWADLISGSRSPNGCDRRFDVSLLDPHKTRQHRTAPESNLEVNLENNMSLIGAVYKGNNTDPGPNRLQRADSNSNLNVLYPATSLVNGSRNWPMKYEGVSAVSSGTISYEEMHEDPGISIEITRGGYINTSSSKKPAARVSRSSRGASSQGRRGNIDASSDAKSSNASMTKTNYNNYSPVRGSSVSNPPRKKDRNATGGSQDTFMKRRSEPMRSEKASSRRELSSSSNSSAGSSGGGFDVSTHGGRNVSQKGNNRGRTISDGVRRKARNRKSTPPRRAVKLGSSMGQRSRRDEAIYPSYDTPDFPDTRELMASVENFIQERRPCYVEHCGFRKRALTTTEAESAQALPWSGCELPGSYPEQPGAGDGMKLPPFLVPSVQGGNSGNVGIAEVRDYGDKVGDGDEEKADVTMDTHVASRECEYSGKSPVCQEDGSSCDSVASAVDGLEKNDEDIAKEQTDDESSDDVDDEDAAANYDGGEDSHEEYNDKNNDDHDDEDDVDQDDDVSTDYNVAVAEDNEASDDDDDNDDDDDDDEDGDNDDDGDNEDDDYENDIYNDDDDHNDSVGDEDDNEDDDSDNDEDNDVDNHDDDDGNNYDDDNKDDDVEERVDEDNDDDSSTTSKED